MKKAFTVAEIIIAVTFMGIIAVLTLPGLTSSFTVRQRLHAYNQAYKKVSEVVSTLNGDPETRVDDATEETGWYVFKTLNEVLPVTGYVKYLGNTMSESENPNTKSTIQNTNSSDDKLHLGARWIDGNKSITIGSTSDVVENDNAHGGFSPWIVTQSGMAFSVNAWSYVVEENKNEGIEQIHTANCYPVSTINKAGTAGMLPSGYYTNGDLRRAARRATCIEVMIDVNGLDKGPNKLPAKGVIDKSDMEKEVKKADRYMIFIARNSEEGKNGAVTPGPEGLTEYWMFNKNKVE